MKKIEQEMVSWGARLFERRLVSGWGGNLSYRLGKERYLITGQHAPLGFLLPTDICEIDGTGRPTKKQQKPSSETSLHLAVYEATDGKAVIHAHPPGVLVFSLSHSTFVPLSFEEKYTLGGVPVLLQETPTVTETARVAQELRVRPIVILQGHGTVAVGRDLQEAFLLTDLLEEAVRCQFLRNPGNSEEVHLGQKSEPVSEIRGEAFPLFSREHMMALIESANADEQFQAQSRESGLTTTLTLDLEDPGVRWTVRFVDGNITGIESEDNGEFAIRGKREWWQAVFENRIDPFLATQQGKLRLVRGELWKLSQWFKPFQRAFQLWQKIPVQ